MHLLAHRVAQCPVYQLMAFHQRTAFKFGRDYEGLEMIAPAGHVAHFNFRPGKGLFDLELDLCYVHLGSHSNWSQPDKAIRGPSGYASP
jgi:hypothetical protein